MPKYVVVAMIYSFRYSVIFSARHHQWLALTLFTAIFASNFSVCISEELTVAASTATVAAATSARGNSGATSPSDPQTNVITNEYFTGDCKNDEHGSLECSQGTDELDNSNHEHRSDKGDVSNSNDDNNDNRSCQLYMAQSTIPNSGIGIFTAVPLKKGDRVGYPDLVIPIVDQDWHNDGSKSQLDFHWLWSQYDWMPGEIGKLEDEAFDAQACVPGMGALPNCHFRLSNVEESWSHYNTVGLHRRKDPGVGAFTGYHGRESTSIKDLAEGSEIFVDYGEHWFRARENELGLIPLSQSYSRATKFLHKYKVLLSHMESDSVNLEGVVKLELWDMIQRFPYKSRTLAALPKSLTAADRALEVGIKQTELESSIRPVDWLQANGKCLDNLRPDVSTIPQAGRGAFATRFIGKGETVAPAPLIHIPYKETLLMYDVIHTIDQDRDGNDVIEIRNTSSIIGKQLLLNYCFGHNRSTLLLCPYGSGTAYINHNHESPNAKIVWSSPNQPLVHKSSWLNMSIDFLEQQWKTGLSFDYVATRNIEPGEEVFIDYGSEWEDAWNQHVHNWIPVENADAYVDASEFNCFDDCENAMPIRTIEEQHSDPYPDNLDIFCYFNNEDKDREHIWIEELDDWRIVNLVAKFPCSVLKRERTPDELFVYDCEVALSLSEDDDDDDDLDYEIEDQVIVLKNIPQHGIQFVNKPYTSDLFLSNGFRHEMMIPDDLMPTAWKNLDPREIS